MMPDLLMEKFLIKLNDIELPGKIGVFDFEREEGNIFKINIELEISASGFIAEDLESTVSYAEVYDEIKKVMEEEWLLLETVSLSLANRFRQLWPQIKRGRISIDKMRPPIAGIKGNCGVEYLF